MGPPAECVFEGALMTGPSPEWTFERALELEPPRPPCTPWTGCAPRVCARGSASAFASPSAVMVSCAPFGSLFLGVTMDDASPPDELLLARTTKGEKPPVGVMERPSHRLRFHVTLRDGLPASIESI